MSGLGQPSVRSAVRSASSERTNIVVDVDEGDPHARPDPELVEERAWCRPGPWTGIVAAMLLVYGPRSADYDFGADHPLTPRRFGPFDRPPAGGRGDAGTGAGARGR